MADFFERLDRRLIRFIEAQKIFFTATAPAEGRINLSPKGMDTLRVLGGDRLAYLDLTGSGNETAAHLREDPRMTLMVCSFDRSPMILRVYGRGSVAERGSERYGELAVRFEDLPGARQIIELEVDSVQTSCGYAVPRMDFVEERQMLRQWAEKKGPDGIVEYRRANNTRTIDGRPTGHPDEDGD